MDGDSSTVHRAGIAGIALLVVFSMVAGIGAGVTVTDDSPKIDGDATDGAGDDSDDGEEADDSTDDEENTTEDDATEEMEVTADDVEEVIGENEEMMGMTFQDIADILNEMMATSGSSV